MSHINSPLPNLSIAALPQDMMLTNLYLLSIIPSPLEGRKKRKGRHKEKEILGLTHHFFQISEAGIRHCHTILVQAAVSLHSASENRIQVGENSDTQYLDPIGRGARTLHKLKGLRLRASGPAFKLSCTILECIPETARFSTSLFSLLTLGCKLAWPSRADAGYRVPELPCSAGHNPTGPHS